MKPSAAYQQRREAIRQTVEWPHASDPCIFGPVRHEEDTGDRNLDTLIDIIKTLRFDVAAISAELLGVEGDMVRPGVLPNRWQMQAWNDHQAI